MNEVLWNCACSSWLLEVIVNVRQLGRDQLEQNYVICCIKTDNEINIYLTSQRKKGDYLGKCSACNLTRFWWCLAMHHQVHKDILSHNLKRCESTVVAQSTKSCIQL